jgi:hypothetical protein
MTLRPAAPTFPTTNKAVDLLLDSPLQLRLENDTQQLVIQALTTETGSNEPVTINVRFSSAAGGQLIALLQGAIQNGVLSTRSTDGPTLQ